MIRYELPTIWDAKKFAQRYGFDVFAGHFYVDAEGKLVVPTPLPDDPPIFDLPDPPVVTKTIEQRLADLEADVTVLKSRTPAIK